MENGGGPGNMIVEAENLDFHYGEKQALFGIGVGIRRGVATAFIGPSG